MRKSQSGKNHHMFGKTLPLSTRRKMSESRQGKKNGFYGKTHTKESREKMSKSLTGLNMKAVIVNGVWFESLKAVSEHYKCRDSTVHGWLSGRAKPLAKYNIEDIRYA